MVLDYDEGTQAALALNALWGAGVTAVYMPDKIVIRSPDPLATLLLVHRIEVPDADSVRALAVLDRFALRPPQKPDPAN